MDSDKKHKEVRKYRPPAFADFMDAVYLEMPYDIKQKLSEKTFEYINSIVTYALDNLDTFQEILIHAIKGVYEQSPGGERFIQDPKRTNSIIESMLFVDRENNLISVANPVLEREEVETNQSILLFKRYQSYTILSGPKQGQKFDDYSRPIDFELTFQNSGSGDKRTTQKKPDKQLQIFLCHASEDKEKVRSLYHDLKEKGFNPWLDEIEILPGKDWDLEIQIALKKSDAILVCLSPNSEKRGYIQKEIVRALDIAQEFPEGSIFIIPVRFENCSVPMRLSKWQWVDLWKEDGIAKLLMALNSIDT